MSEPNPPFSVIGDWMGSIYGAGGQREETHLFLDHDGRFERTVREDDDKERHDKGRWELDESHWVLRLISDTPNEFDKISDSWRVLSVTTCEESNCLLVLRWLILGSRNLPIVFYRVHCDKRGYGTGWEDRMAQLPK